ncbi:MAG: hypothetical protein MK102_15125 [Fuerstiella sp.]|nr:hypothetical protein [Fuerstiella sp.]
MLFNTNGGKHVFYRLNASLNEKTCGVVIDLSATQTDVFIPSMRGEGYL